jgi:hypothetical protein
MRRLRVLAVAVAASALLASPAGGAVPSGSVVITDELASPVFGLSAGPGKRLYVADAGAGIVQIHKGRTSLFAPLGGVTDVAPLGAGELLALAPPDETSANALVRVSRRRTVQVADLAAFEEAVNPDGQQVESNPFDLARLNGHRTLVADAAGNSVLHVDASGRIDWVAAFPDRIVSTQWLKDAIGCPDVEDPELAELCDLPAEMSADAVPTSVAIGPDGAYYVTELRGFPATPGTSRVWRIAPGTRHAMCGTSPACTVVADGLTSIIDINFDSGGIAYVLELDEATWLAAEEGLGVGGTLNTCTPADAGMWTCVPSATELTFPTAVAIQGGAVYVTVEAVFPAFGPGQAKVVRLP